MDIMSEGLRDSGEFITLAGTPDGDDLELKAEILPTHTALLFNVAVVRAVDALCAGDVVALPTETVYGLAASALDSRAVARIFEMKGRPEHNPIIVHVVGLDMARRCVADWPPAAEALARAFWPGPLTMVLPRSKEIPDVVTAGGDTVGIRWPSHPFIQAVIGQCGFPLAAPSANPSNQVSPTNAEHVSKSLGNQLSLIVDGGQSQIGIESTVLDLTSNPLRILRPGMIDEASIRAVVADNGLSVATSGASDAVVVALRSPGRLPKHYSPRAPLQILSWHDDKDLRSQISQRNWAISGVHVIAHTIIPAAGGFGRVSVIPHDAEAFARALYAELHLCDDTGAKRIIVETLPDTHEWQAIADRLKRAAS